ncbi:MAG: hypothetical protein OEQ53_05175 [Saprospiraceae bacterium]|nr:hypothetical protein [Saprospiraceae bacterium]
MINEHNLSIIYSGDHSEFRKKNFGATLLDQALHSIVSVRNNWSTVVPIYFTHTKALPDYFIKKLADLDVQTVHSSRYALPDYPLANKINFATVGVETEYLLFLDCDTVVHQPLSLDSGADLLIAYDALSGLGKDEFSNLFNRLHVTFPPGKFYESPAFEYYYGDHQDIFPAWNSGVFVLRSDLRTHLADCWSQKLLSAFEYYQTASWAFYLEQASFIVSIFAIELNYEILPKGYNFICTPRAGYLRQWDRSNIYIEHYAGDSSVPLRQEYPIGKMMGNK